METITAEKMSALSNAQIAILLKESFFKLGKKMELCKEEIDLFINDIRKYQGRMNVADFEEAFALFAAGELTNAEKLNVSVSPLFVGRLMKAYKASGQSSVVSGQSAGASHQPSAISHPLTDEHHWHNYIKHLMVYHSLQVNPNWIALFNYCVYKGWLTDVRPIEEWNYKAYRLAQKDVLAFTRANWGELITDNCVYSPTKHSLAGTGGGLQGLGTRLRLSIHNS